MAKPDAHHQQPPYNTQQNVIIYRRFLGLLKFVSRQSADGHPQPGRYRDIYAHPAHIEYHKCPDLSKAAYYDSQAWRFEHLSPILQESSRALCRQQNVPCASAPRAEHLSVVSKKLGAPVRRLARRRVGARTRRSQVPASALPIGPHARGPVGNFWWLLVVTVGVGRAASNLPSGRDGKGGDSVSCFREPHPAGLALILLLYPPAAPPFSAYH